MRIEDLLPEAEKLRFDHPMWATCFGQDMIKQMALDLLDQGMPIDDIIPFMQRCLSAADGVTWPDADKTEGS